MERAALGLDEAGNFTAATKTVVEWFSKKERALVAGGFNSGANTRTGAAPLLVPCLGHYDRQTAFVRTGAIAGRGAPKGPPGVRWAF